MAEKREQSPLPTDRYDQQLARLTGLPNGAQVAPVVVQTVDFYGRSTDWIVQTVKTDEGDTIFLKSIDADQTVRLVIPARVLATIDRQRQTLTSKVRRRHGRRLADERKQRGEQPAFLKAKAAKRR